KKTELDQKPNCIIKSCVDQDQTPALITSKELRTKPNGVFIRRSSLVSPKNSATRKQSIKKNRVLLAMANGQMKSVATLLLVLNFCMYVIVLGIGGWAMNRAIDYGFIIGPGFELPAHFSPIFFPIGNAATGFFVTFALIAGVVGAASSISGVSHVRAWNSDSLQAAAAAGTIAWTLTLLAMGFACKQIEMEVRNARLKTMEAFLIILSATQLLYIAAIHGAVSVRR
ncbi:Membrane protein PM19L, partial [Linum grandiflorum]